MASILGSAPGAGFQFPGQLTAMPAAVQPGQQPVVQGPAPAAPVTPEAAAAPAAAQQNPAYQNAFNNYLNSTGYQFMLGQGQDAITGSAAARGLLNSGATAKALTKYGQDTGSQYFDKYMSQLGNMNNTLGGTASAGQNALGQIATVGTTGGGNSANALIQGAANQGALVMRGGNALANAYAGLGGAVGNAFGNAFPSFSLGGMFR